MDQTYVTKWDIPTYLLNGTNYPEYLSGSAYIIPQYTLPCLYESALTTPVFPINDVFITGYLAKMCRLSLISTKNFQPFEVSKVVFDQNRDLWNGRKLKKCWKRESLQSKKSRSYWRDLNFKELRRVAKTTIVRLRTLKASWFFLKKQKKEARKWSKRFLL